MSMGANSKATKTFSVVSCNPTTHPTFIPTIYPSAKRAIETREIYYIAQDR